MKCIDPLGPVYTESLALVHLGRRQPLYLMPQIGLGTTEGIQSPPVENPPPVSIILILYSSV